MHILSNTLQTVESMATVAHLEATELLVVLGLRRPAAVRAALEVTSVAVLQELRQSAMGRPSRGRPGGALNRTVVVALPPSK